MTEGAIKNPLINETTGTQVADKKNKNSKYLILIIGFIVLAIILIYFLIQKYNTLSFQKNIKIMPTATPVTEEGKAKEDKNFEVIIPKISEGFKSHSSDHTVTKKIRYELKYPEQLLAKEAVRGYKGRTDFFATNDNFQAYSYCVEHGSESLEGKDTPRDWEGLCELSNLLFDVDIVEGNYSIDDLGDNINYYSNVNNLRIATNSEFSEGGQQEIYIEALLLNEVSGNPNGIKIVFSWPTKTSFDKTEETTRIDNSALVLKILSALQVAIDKY